MFATRSAQMIVPSRMGCSVVDPTSPCSDAPVWYHVESSRRQAKLDPVEESTCSQITPICTYLSNGCPDNRPQSLTILLGSNIRLSNGMFMAEEY